MSSTDAREQAGEPAVPGQAGPGGADESARRAVAARRGGHAAAQDAMGGDAGGGPAVTGHRRRRRGWVLALAVVVVAAAGLGGADAAGVFRGPKPAASTSAYATGTAAVTRGPLTEQTQENGTVGDSGSYTVVVPGSSGGSGSSPGSGASTFTWLPQAGQTIRQGQEIYQVSGTPVVLLYGSVPAYRDLAEGMTGADVTELNTDLVRLGYATAAALGPRREWDYFSSETAYALGLLQAHLGLTVTGSLPLGQAVFLPGAVRVASLGSGAVPGGTATAGATVLTGSSLSPVVTVDLDASLQSEVAVGDKVSVTLPDNATTPGVISQITTASASSSSPATGSGDTGSGDTGSGDNGSDSGNDGSASSASNTATITVVVSLTNPKAAGSLNQAPVEVTITTGSVSNALIVPVDALLAQPGGRYAVEVTGPRGHHLVAVTPGLFDDAAGTVQVTGKLTPSQRVVVPGT
jgi:Putative peptidoglycan binding domain